MANTSELNDYEPVKRSVTTGLLNFDEVEKDWLPVRSASNPEIAAAVDVPNDLPSSAKPDSNLVRLKTKKLQPAESWVLKQGHALSYAALFLFTFLVYFRPYELFPSFSWLSRSAFVVATITLAIFLPTQLSLEDRITARLREVVFVVLLLITASLSIPFALEPIRAFQASLEFLKVVVMFIVMVNVVRTEERLKALILLVLVASCILSVAALNDYRIGNLALQGRRIAGLIGGLFSNPNDLALHLVTMIPISLALFLGSCGVVRRIFYLSCSLLLTGGIIATFSRGGFLGFVCFIGFLVWKLARRNRAFLGIVALAIVLATITLAPTAYRSRLATTNDDSALARTDDLQRSILVAVRHPLFGVGMDNYILYSNTNKATHNAYTQVAAEMGFAAFVFYLGFLIAPFTRLRRIERATGMSKHKPTVYYLAVGLQASMVAYMVASFFASVAYLWYVYYLVGYSVCLGRIYSICYDDVKFVQSPDEETTQISSKPGLLLSRLGEVSASELKVS